MLIAYRDPVSITNLQGELPRIAIVTAQHPSRFFHLLKKDCLQSFAINFIPFQGADHAQAGDLPEGEHRGCIHPSSDLQQAGTHPAENAAKGFCWVWRQADQWFRC